MPLIHCPECNNRISDRAESCPHCGLPSRFFASTEANGERAAESATPLDMAALRNTLISFEHSYQIGTISGKNF